MGNSTSPGDGIFHWEANEPYHKSFWIPQREQGISSEMHKPVYAVSQEKAERESYLLPNTLFPAGKWLHMEGTTCRSHLALVQWEEKKKMFTKCWPRQGTVFCASLPEIAILYILIKMLPLSSKSTPHLTHLKNWLQVMHIVNSFHKLASISPLLFAS